MRVGGPDEVQQHKQVLEEKRESEEVGSQTCHNYSNVPERLSYKYGAMTSCFLLAQQDVSSTKKYAHTHTIIFFFLP